ncbi:MAG: hypothetical protein WCH39_15750 [Schlesneria sp.]
MNVYLQNDMEFICDAVQLADDFSPIIDMALALSIGRTDVTGVITNATNASPIVVTSAAHGRTTGDQVVITSVFGNVAANGAWTITVIDANTFNLNGSVGSGAFLATGSGIWYLGVLGAVGLTMTYLASPPRYKTTLPGTVPLLLGSTYIRVIQASNYNFHLEDTFTPVTRKG